ncbi:hypothetical protein A3A20_01820 [Candidatus Wolfebacteria bacterium RIFCSPLOWO2_01_FULL_45_19]|uniref:Peptidase M16 n=1 Tax=Candidatus Wolfebacteria bacterium RIFCSPLOWO2_01_FULL_45_19 TaxID=1802557 RepID=A0A1F8DV25_9BACT|nr:MAG: Peptidase M16 domain protein [Parcubacteria group bacterium GW2011_GWB1_45_9]OGM91655.1 MAG: hypothetical protein A3A20_01820 [Candidatus Wolfebacteria bacterium RIFCSPLOWO2_01_FULL_45_19]
MNFKKITLENGLRIITVPKKDSTATTVLVLVEAGSKYETKDINGLSHFLEHMCFKGTKKRPKPGLIAKELDTLGAEYNAFTGQESTGYHAKVQNKDVDEALDIVSDLYLNPVFNPDEINKERGVIIEEINMYEDTPMRRVQEFFTSLLYGDQPAGWDIAGRKEVIDRLTREDFVKYRGEHYLAKSTLVVVAGNFDEKKVTEKIMTHFSEIPDTRKVGKVKTTELQLKPGIFVKHKESDQTHLVLGVRAFDMFDQRRFALEMLSVILGGGMSSRLFQRVREELGAAYYVNASADLYSDHGYLATAAGVDHRKIDEVINAILEEFTRFTKEKVSDEELGRAKSHFSGRLLLGLEGSDDLAGFYGGQEIIKREIITPEELVSKLQAITADEIMAVARDIMKNDGLNLALIGPFKEAEKIEKLLSL